MKTLEELKKLRKEWLNEKHSDIETELDEELFEEWKNCNFVAYNAYSDSISVFDNYQLAKKYCEQGGQVLVLDKEKIYTYKMKTDEEYYRYLDNQLKYENLKKKNYYGL